MSWIPRQPRTPFTASISIVLLAVFALFGAAPVSTAQTSISITVSANSDDADQDPSTGQMWVGDGYSNLDNYVGERFQNVTIPAGATITSATLELFSRNTTTSSFSVNIHAQDADSPSTFSTSNYDLSNRTRTSASVGWTVSSVSYTADQSFTSPDFSAVVQEVVDRSGWSSGNSLVVITVPVSGLKQVWKLSGKASCAPKLHITYMTDVVGKILLVTSGSSLNSEETARKSQFESWGYAVTTIEDSSSQSAFNTAASNVDVVYIPSTVQSYDVSSKCKNFSVGVVSEERRIDNAMGFSTNEGWESNETQTSILVNSHPITSGFSTGYVTIVNSSQPMVLMNSTVASSMTVLSNKPSAGNGNMLGAIEAGDTLADATVAAGRRVRMPWGGDSFQWSALNSNGLLIAQQAIEWAAGLDQSLLLHWKFDESSGTTAADDSGYSRNGTLSGTTAWSSAMRDGGVSMLSSGKCTVNTRLGEPASFTVAGWADLTASDSHGAAILSIGNCVALLAHELGHGSPAISFWNGGSIQTVSASGGSRIGTGWHHYCATFDNTTKALKLYIDGELVGSGTASGSPDYSVGSTTIAGDEGTPYYALQLTGALDDVRVYGEVLSAQEVVELYGLIGHWSLDDGTGTTATDESPNANDATFYTGSPTWVSGVRSSALEFNGTSDLKTGSNLDPPAIGTIAFWFHPGAEPQATERLFGASDSWEVRLASGSYLYFDVNIGGGPNTNLAFTDSNLWTHIAYLYDVEAGTYEMYLNGQFHKSGTLTQTDQSAAILSIGTRTGSTNWFSGGLDDLQVYNYQLSAARIAELYGLVGHWKLDETSGTTAADSSGMGNHGAHEGGILVGEDGTRGYSTEHDGASSRTRVDRHASLNITGPVSIAAWVKTFNAGQTQKIATNQSGSSGYRLSSTASYLQFYLPGLSPAAYVQADPLETNAWTQVVGVYDGSSIKLYVNGELVSEQTASGSISGSAADVFLGESTSDTTPFYGNMDDVVIYNRAMLPQEIARHFGLIGHWRLDESSGTVAADSSGMQRDGEIYGAPVMGVGGPSVNNNSMEFDGIDDFIVLPTYEDDFQEGVTVAGWAKPTALGSFEKIIQLAQGTTNAIDIGRAASYEGIRGVADGMGDILTFTDFTNNVWQHYAMTIDHTGLQRLYINGALVQEIQRSTLPNIYVRTTNYIGESNWVNDDLFTGRLHDVRVYNRGASTQEVEEMYNGTAPHGVRILKWVESR